MRFKLVDSDNRLSVKYNKVDGLFNWGADNLYPSLIKNLIEASVTARNCSKLNTKYIYGKGFNFEGKNTVINKDGITLNQLLRIAAKETTYTPNLFFHINYNALFEVVSVSIIPATDVRIGTADSKGYSGKFVVYDWDKCDGKKADKKNFTVIDRFNSLPTIIEAQVEAAGGWNKYKGQILHVSNDYGSIYALSDADCVLKDMDSEINVAEYKNNCLRDGFFGAKLVVTKPFGDDFERQDFEDTINEMKGFHKNSPVLMLEAKNVSDDLNGEFIIEDIDSNIDDKKFEHTEITSSQNIRKAFGVPAILLEDSDNSIFGDSGALLKEARKTYWDDKEEERNTITEAFQTIFSKWHEIINPNNDWSIIPIITLENTQYNAAAN